MTSTATNINEKWSLGIPALRFLLDWVDVPACCFPFAAVRHVFIELGSVLRVLREPFKGRQRRFVSHLMGRVCGICHILILDLRKEAGE